MPGTNNKFEAQTTLLLEMPVVKEELSSWRG